MLKVLYLLDSSHVGGAEHLTLNVVNNISKLKVEPTLLISCKKGDLSPEIDKAKVKKIFFPRTKKIDLGLIRKIREVAKENSIDIIHTNSPVEGIHAYLACNERIKIILSHHGFTFEDKLKDKLSRNFLLRRVDANIFVSKINFEFFRKKHKFIKNPHILKNGVDFDYLDSTVSLKKESGLRKKYYIKKEKCNWGMVGNFYNSGRDQLTICKAMQIILPRHSELHFYFVGGWSKKNPKYYLKCYEFCKQAGIDGNVHFLGLQKDIANLLAIFELFVYSTDHDVHPLSLIEAIGMGKPVLANDHPSILESTGDGKYIEIFRSKDPLHLAKRMAGILESGKLKPHPLAKSWIRKKFSIKKHIQGLKKIYQFVTNEK